MKSKFALRRNLETLHTISEEPSRHNVSSLISGWFCVAHKRVSRLRSINLDSTFILNALFLNVVSTFSKSSKKFTFIRFWSNVNSTLLIEGKWTFHPSCIFFLIFNVNSTLFGSEISTPFRANFNSLYNVFFQTFFFFVRNFRSLFLFIETIKTTNRYFIHFFVFKDWFFSMWVLFYLFFSLSLCHIHISLFIFNYYLLLLRVAALIFWLFFKIFTPQWEDP